MATLQTTSVSGNITGVNHFISQNGGMTDWQKISHCANAQDTNECNPVYSCGYIHIRTPLPADASATSIGWIPMCMEVVGYHTYSAERFHDFKAIINTTGDGNNTYYTPTIRSNRGNSVGGSIAAPVFYRSNSTYGGYRRTCLVLPKIGCCCTGYIWIRWNVNYGYRTDYAWATIGQAGTTAYW